MTRNAARRGRRRATTGRPAPTGVFVAGDMHRGASLIVWAIAEGRAAAAAIHTYLGAAATCRRRSSPPSQPLAAMRSKERYREEGRPRGRPFFASSSSPRQLFFVSARSSRGAQQAFPGRRPLAVLLPLGPLQDLLLATVHVIAHPLCHPMLSTRDNPSGGSGGG